MNWKPSITALFLAGCWISPSDWEKWDIDHGEFDTATPEGDADTDADGDSDTDSDAVGDSDTDADSDTTPSPCEISSELT